MTNKSQISASILADSRNLATGDRLTTFQVRVPKFLLAEINTHRMLSKNFASSRAIPASKIREQVIKDPFIPVYWGKNQKGMTASVEMTGWPKDVAIQLYLSARYPAVVVHWLMDKVGVHKQHCNRLLETYMWADGIISATEFENFFRLRTHKDAQPEFRVLATQMQQLAHASEPKLLQPGEWHIPLTNPLEPSLERRKQISAGNCAAVSYQFRERSDDKAIDICQRLATATPPHMSPLEHQAMALHDSAKCGNLVGFQQFRKEFTDESGCSSEMYQRLKMEV